MKKTLSLLLTFFVFTTSGLLAQAKLKPYMLGTESTETLQQVRNTLLNNMTMSGLTLAGEYQPAQDNSRWLLVVSSPELISAVQKVGELTGFAATLRVAITVENGKTMVSYTNPFYWGNAYFRADYQKVANHYTKVNEQIEKLVKTAGNFIGTGFGSAEGLTANELHSYHYMMGMPYFDDTEELGEFASHQTAVDKVDAALKTGKPNLKLVYKVVIPGKDLCLYGFELSGPTGEAKFLPIVDKGSPRHTAFLPYELLVKGNEVHMLHGRFRIALSFPDLTMGTFSKIMSTPGDIETLLEQVVK